MLVFVFPFQCKIVFTELLSGVVLTLAVSHDTVEMGGGGERKNGTFLQKALI